MESPAFTIGFVLLQEKIINKNKDKPYIMKENKVEMNEYLNESYVGLIKPNNINDIVTSLIDFLHNREIIFFRSAAISTNAFWAGG